MTHKLMTHHLLIGRKVEGMLRGFDPFMNLVIDDGIEMRKDGERVRIGVSVSMIFLNIRCI